MCTARQEVGTALNTLMKASTLYNLFSICFFPILSSGSTVNEAGADIIHINEIAISGRETDMQDTEAARNNLDLLREIAILPSGPRPAPVPRGRP